MSWAWFYGGTTAAFCLLVGYSIGQSTMIGLWVLCAFRSGYREAVDKWRKEQARRMLAELKATGRVTERTEP